MATGDPVVKILRITPPAATAAFLTRLAGASTPAENVLVWNFADGTQNYLDFLCALEGYDGGGLTFRLGWGSSATTGNVEWELAVRAIPDDAEDLDTTAHTYDYNVSAVAVPSAAGEVAYDNITFTDGVDMDSWADATLAIVRLTRNAGAGNAEDTAAGAAHLHGFWGRET